MSDRGWKQFERRCAKDMGTTRIAVTGERAGADARTALFKFQFKLRKMLPDWVFEWLDGICQAAGDGQVGVLVIKTPRMKDADAIVLLRWKDWVDLHGSKPQPGGTDG